MSGGRRARRARRGRRGSEELQLCLLSSEAPGQDLPALPPDVLDSRYWQLSCWSKARVRISLFEDEGQEKGNLRILHYFIPAEIIFCRTLFRTISQYLTL